MRSADDTFIETILINTQQSTIIISTIKSIPVLELMSESPYVQAFAFWNTFRRRTSKRSAIISSILKLISGPNKP